MCTLFLTEKRQANNEKDIFFKNSRWRKIHNFSTTTNMATSNAKSSLDDDEESELSHAFSTNSKFANAQVREIVKDNVFPIAKFLRSEDLPWSTEPKSWCSKMASWCHIEPTNLELWWQTVKKSILQELQHQRANKTNVIKREFFGK